MCDLHDIVDSDESDDLHDDDFSRLGEQERFDESDDEDEDDDDVLSFFL